MASGEKGERAHVKKTRSDKKKHFPAEQIAEKRTFIVCTELVVE